MSSCKYSRWLPQLRRQIIYARVQPEVADYLCRFASWGSIPLSPASDVYGHYIDTAGTVADKNSLADCDSVAVVQAVTQWRI